MTAIIVTTLFALVSLLAFCQAVPVLIPSGNELIYNYRAIINVGTYEPATFASQFILNGKLHMQKLDDKHVMMKLSDLTYKLYNGELTHDHDEELTALPLSDEIYDLLEPFVMTYNEHGQIQTMVTDKKDRKFSRDMKRGIGSLMQLDMEHIKLDAKEGYVFSSKENNLYGNVHVDYHVMPEHDVMKVDKMMDLGNVPKKWKTYLTTTDDVQEFWARDPLTIGSHRTYTLAKQDNVQYIKEIKSQGRTLVAMMKGMSESHIMLVNQDLVWFEMNPIKTPMTKPEHALEENLQFELGNTDDDESLVDLSFGRSTMKMEQYEKLIYAHLERGMKHMEMTHLKMESPDLHMGQWMNHVRLIMALLDLKTMEHMFVTMEEKTGAKDKEMFKVFQKIMPLVGTRASVLLMRNLIRKQKVDDEMAMTMLTQMPFHLQMPSEKLLTELEDMMHLENVNSTIQETATLTFATMIHKVFNNHIMQTGKIPDSQLLEKYIEKFMDLLKNAKDYSSQYLYMNALYNIRLGSVQKHMEPYVTGEATNNRHLRYLAMCVSFTEVIKNPQKVFELYWPIFADPTLHLELRAGAYSTLMATKPSKTKLMNMYWILKNDPCPELYHMHWSYLRSIVYSTDINLQGYKDMATEMLNFMREPMHHTLTGRYMMDFMDPNFGFGSMMGGTFMSTNTSKSMFFDLSSNMYNLPIMDWALWLKIDGMDPTIISQSQRHLENIENSSMLEQLIGMIMSMKDQKNLHIEYAILHNDKIIMMDFADHTTIDTLHVHMMNLMKMNDMTLSLKQMTQIILPNDLGFPVVMDLVMPVVSYTKFDMKNDNTDAATVKLVDWKYMESSHNGYGIVFYNPIPDIWQGIERCQVNEMMSTMNFKMNMDKDMKIKMTINKQDNDSMDKFAMRNYATSLVYILRDNNNDLQKSSNNSEHYTIISRGEDYRHSKILFEHDCPHTGLMFQVGVFDTKKHVSRRTMMELWRDLTQRYFKNYQTMPFGYMLLTLKNSMQYMLISPDVGTFGFMIRATPSKKYPVNHIDLSLRATVEHIKQIDQHLPHTKMNTRFTWATKSKDNKMLRSWDTNAILDMNPGHTLNNYKIHFSMETPDEKQFKMCVVGMRKWLNNKVIGHMNMTMGHTDDATTCVDNQGIIQMDMKGGLSNEQKNMIIKKLTYDECMPVNMYEPLLEGLKIDYEANIKCSMKQSLMRKFEYDIKATGIPEKCMERMHNMLDFMKGWMMPYYSQEKSNVVMDEDNMKVVMEYPMGGHEMNMEITTPKMKHMFKEAPNTMMNWMGFQPESYHYSSLATWMYKMGMVESCMIVDQHMYTHNYEVMEMKKDDWMMVVQNNPEMSSNHSLTIFVKRMEGTKAMGLRIKMDEKILEILPQGETYKIIWDNKPMTISKGSYQNEDIFSIGMLHDKHNTIIMHMYNFNMYLDYAGEQMRIDKHKMDMYLTGPCFQY